MHTIRISPEAYARVVEECSKKGHPSLEKALDSMLRKPSLLEVGGNLERIANALNDISTASEEIIHLKQQLTELDRKLSQRGYTCWLEYKERGGKLSYEDWYQMVSHELDSLVKPSEADVDFQTQK